jgi:type II secretory ATPase GspE/PulE/Tfp pilus assembly ATPase PilB-like protein
MDPRTDLRHISDLGLPTTVAAQLSAVIHERDGAILMTGPAGSGKTTTLYAALREIVAKSEGGRAVLTVEDPIESILEGVSQSRLEPSAGFDMPTALRSMLRQDAEVLLVGEIRDPESAEAALRAALTGHLVFSSLHAGDVATALRRLQELGLAGYLIRSGVRAIFSQRLLRKLCPDCRSESRTASESRLSACWRAVGCDRCFATGYSGRIVVAECLRIDRGPQADAVAAAFDRELPSGEIYTAARQAGLITMLDAARKLAESGTTTPEELFRVFGRIVEF